MFPVPGRVFPLETQPKPTADVAHWTGMRAAEIPCRVSAGLQFASESSTWYYDRRTPVLHQCTISNYGPTERQSLYFATQPYSTVTACRERWG